MSLKGKRGGKIYFWGDNRRTEYPVISFITARKLARQGCVVYLSCVTEDRKEEVKLEDILVVKEFLYVFSKEISRLPPRREIDFKIEFEPGARPISKPP